MQFTNVALPWLPSWGFTDRHPVPECCKGKTALARGAGLDDDEMMDGADGLFEAVTCFRQRLQGWSSIELA